MRPWTHLLGLRRRESLQGDGPTRRIVPAVGRAQGLSSTTRASFAWTHSPWQQWTVQQESVVSALLAVVSACHSSRARTAPPPSRLQLKAKRPLVHPHPWGVILCNLRRHAGMHPGQSTAQGHQTAGSRRWQGPDQPPTPPTTSMGTWSCSLIRSSAYPGMRMAWEPSYGRQWVSVARKPCWWTGASWGCWPALMHRCSSRPCPLSWVVWALWSGGWSDASISKKGSAGQLDLQYRPSQVGAQSLLTVSSSPPATSMTKGQ